MFKTGKILYKQMELLAKDSGNCMPGELPKNSQAMTEIGKVLLKYKLFETAMSLLCAYLVGCFLELVVQLLRFQIL